MTTSDVVSRSRGRTWETWSWWSLLHVCMNYVCTARLLTWWSRRLTYSDMSWLESMVSPPQKRKQITKRSPRNRVGQRGHRTGGYQRLFRQLRGAIRSTQAEPGNHRGRSASTMVNTRRDVSDLVGSVPDMVEEHLRDNPKPMIIRLLQHYFP